MYDNKITLYVHLEEKQNAMRMSETLGATNSQAHSCKEKVAGIS
jgi:hypothetical protein